MKNILTLLWTINLIGTSTISLVACNTPQYTEKELADLKEKNKINTDNQEIKDNLEWIKPQEKPFNNNPNDNKYFFVVWRSAENIDWRIVKFQNNNATKELDNQGEFILRLSQLGGWRGIDLAIFFKNSLRYRWLLDKNYFKSVYRWNIYKNIPNLTVDSKTGEVKVESK
ncbi:hypothetical protein D6D54_05645 [Spiroplasma poulsonii]|uniref:Lipoprotein n=1 Tax=Spiroplasma poulsonii TaxID=2138 RepID=A0A3S0ZW03_9MOLU|nr:hypothetical protein [Spiroplasma poulsonii]MBW3059024.1 hypothetical protein [Spiroplasma poulsonii]RUP76521.1 hypothetical protein D6D54_05645 [Spiroplasma poulsonii]